jgi:alpha-beta hydrolase superfamily lysophospholipase
MYMRAIFFGGILFVFWGGVVIYTVIFFRHPDKETKPHFYMPEVVKFKTRDAVEIVGDYYAAERSRGVLLLHMMPANRKSWISFAEKLQKSGFKVLAIDLRGHGESEGGPDGYKKFSDKEHQDSRLDVEAAMEFLKSKGVDEFHLVGASIGANLSLQFASEHPEVLSAILLSPGLNYRGVVTMPAMTKIRPEAGVYLVAAKDDGYSYDTVVELAKFMSRNEKHVLKVYDSGGHGTRLFDTHPEFIEELVKWLLQF